MPEVGLEPTQEIRQSIANKELMIRDKTYSARHSAISLQEIIENHPELERLIMAWDELPEEAKQAILSVIK